MGHIETKTFKSGNSVAVRLPKALGFAPGTPVRVELDGQVVTIRPTVDADANKRRLMELIEAMDRLPKPSYIERREPIEFPDRPGL